MLLLLLSLVTTLPPRYFPCTNGDPHRSDSLLSLPCHLTNIVDLLNVLLTWLPVFPIFFCQSGSCNCYRYDHTSHESHSLYLYTQAAGIILFLLPFARHFCPQILPHLSLCIYRKCVIPVVCVKLGKLYVVKHNCVTWGEFNDYIMDNYTFRPVLAIFMLS